MESGKYAMNRNGIDDNKLRTLRERIRQRVEHLKDDPSRLHEACFLAEVLADIDEIGWPDAAVSAARNEQNRKDTKMQDERVGRDAVRTVIDNGIAVEAIEYMNGDVVEFPNNRAYLVVGNTNQDTMIMVTNADRTRIDRAIGAWSLRCVHYA